jgi:hypothetical protein
LRPRDIPARDDIVDDHQHPGIVGLEIRGGRCHAGPFPRGLDQQLLDPPTGADISDPHRQKDKDREHERRLDEAGTLLSSSATPGNQTHVVVLN